MADLEKSRIGRITDAGDIEHGISVLRDIDPTLVPIIDGLSEIPLRLRPAGFHGLAEIVVGQQVSKASAAAIFGRLADRVQPFTAEQFLIAGETAQIEAGLSRAKQVTLTGLARAIIAEQISLLALCEVPVDEAMAHLTQLKGIGPWTAEVFLLFCAGHADVFPAGDVALQQAIADIHHHDSRPDTRQTRVFAERWSPVRGIAARVLWADYARRRQSATLPV